MTLILVAAVMSYYVNDVGIFASMAGDLTSAQEYFSIAVNVDRDADDAGNLAVGLQGLADCLARTRASWAGPGCRG